MRWRGTGVMERARTRSTRLGTELLVDLTTDVEGPPAARAGAAPAGGADGPAGQRISRLGRGRRRAGAAYAAGRNAGRGGSPLAGDRSDRRGERGLAEGGQWRRCASSRRRSAILRWSWATAIIYRRPPTRAGPAVSPIARARSWTFARPAARPWHRRRAAGGSIPRAGDGLDERLPGISCVQPRHRPRPHRRALLLSRRDPQRRP